MMHFYLLAPLLMALVSCDSGGTKDAAFEARFVALEKSNKELKIELERLTFRSDINEWDKFAFMKPGNEGYSTLRFDLGVVTVRIADVKPYANGSKITLSFGNLTSARVDGLKAKLDWGKVDLNGNPLNDVAKSREVVLNEPLLPGVWANSDVVLEGVPPIELGFVRLREVGHRGVGLRR